MSLTRYPLSWPTGWTRTPAGARKSAMFGKGEAHTRVHTNTTYTVRRSLTVADARNRLDLELQRLGARDVLLSTNVQVRLDGLPRSGQGEPADAGAAVYFTLKGKPRCLACDRWNRVADNIAAIAAHVYAIRAVDRYGVGTLDQAFAGYAQLPPAPGQDGDPWWTVLNVSPNASRDDVEAAYRDLAKKNHPDVGGSAELMARINRARDAATRALLVAS